MRNGSLVKRLLAGTSALAICAVLTPDNAALAEVYTKGSVAVGPMNFVILDGYFAWGFTNQTLIGPATKFPIVDQNIMAFWIKGNSTFESGFLNNGSILATHDGLNDVDLRYITALRRDASVGINNVGVIAASSSRGSFIATATGVLLNGGGTFTNSGVVSAFASNATLGTKATGLQSKVSTQHMNSGVISAEVIGAPQRNVATGVALDAGGTLINTGSLVSTASANSNGVPLQSIGVSITGQGLLENRGSILAKGDHTKGPLYIFSGGTKSVSAHAVMAKDSWVTNSGKIAAQAIGGPEIYEWGPLGYNVSRTDSSAIGIKAFSLDNSGEITVNTRANAKEGAFASSLGASAEAATNNGLIFSGAQSNAYAYQLDTYDTPDATSVAGATGLDGSRIHNAALKAIWATAVAKATTLYHGNASADAAGFTSKKDRQLKDTFVSLINAGTVVALGRADVAQYSNNRRPCVCDDPSNSASAASAAVGMTQDADSMILSTSGQILVSSEASASTFGAKDPRTRAQADATGIKQLVSWWYARDTQPSVAFSTNSGQITVSAKAKASVKKPSTGFGTPSVSASANAGGIVQQQGPEFTFFVIPGNLEATNTGTMSVSASAASTSIPQLTGELGSTDVSAVGISQQLYGNENSATATNKGVIIVGSAGDDGSAVESSSIGIDQGSTPPLWPTPFTHIAKASNGGEIVVTSNGNGGTTDVTAIGIRQTPLGEATAENAGKVSVQAQSMAANAGAVARVAAVEQQALQDPNSRTFTVENTGSMTATGFAHGVGNARVDSFGVSQRARNLSSGNAGTIMSESTATAQGAFIVSSSGEAVDADDALAEASSTGLHQRFHGSRAHVQAVGNSGSVAAAATSVASSSFSATAKAVASAIGAHQDTAGGTGSSADLRLINTGTLSGDATARSLGSPIPEDRVNGHVAATATGALQDASEQLAAKVYLENAGSVTAVATGSVGVSVTGTYKSATGLVTAQATGVSQEVSGVSADLANRGSISAISNAASRAMSQGDSTALAYGVNQSGEANTFLYNSGSISASASAATAAPTDGYATARAAGVKQSLDSSSPFQSVNNIGSISAAVTATATGRDSIALGESRGIDAQASDLLPLAIVNYVRAQINSTADATAGSIANAFANGIYVAASTVEGSISNYGTISAVAKATSTDAADGGISRAIGIYDPSGTNNLKIVNAGTIAAYAEANTESGATAIKIMTDEEGAGQRETDASLVASAQMPAALALGPGTTIINDNGVLYAGYSDDGGKTVKRGVAIDATLAPNPVNVVLDGGVILGDIELSSDDTFTMTGPTQILGNVNAPGSDLAVRAGNKLAWLVGTEQTNPENFFGLPVFSEIAPTTMTLASFTVEAGSTLSLRGLSADTASMPSVDATTASLHGTLAVDFGPGLFKDVTVYENLITANTLDGNFSDVIDNSVLLDPAASHDGSSVDLSVTRLPFDAVTGLTGNQHAVAESIEGVYPALNADTDFARLVGRMFTLDSGDYAATLNQLTGAEYAQHLQALLWSTRPVQNLITDRMECFGGTSIYMAPAGTAADGGSSGASGNASENDDGCFVPEQGSVWMRGYGSWNTLEGDESAPGYFERQVGVLVGGDYSFDGNWFAGAAAGYRSTAMDFDHWGGRFGTTIDSDGFQVAAYGGYDNGASYARAALSYGYNYDGDSHRMIQFDGSAIDPSGDLTSSVWSVYAETGHRFDVAENYRITPFVGLSYAGAHLNGFTEDDPEGTGAALKVQDSNATSLATRLGVRLATDIELSPGILTPVLSLGWEHEFKDTKQTLDMSFADAPSGADFEVSGSKSPRDSLWIDAGARFAGDDRFEVGLFYTGLVNEDLASHGATVRFGLKF